MAVDVCVITAEATRALRHRVLRQGRPISSCTWEGDELSTTHHFGLFEGGGEAAAILSCFWREGPHRPGEQAWQLRGMAVDPPRQRRGLGRALLEGCLSQLPDLSEPPAKWIWCNARTTAVPFYLEAGFEALGEVFDVPGIGPHRLMERALVRSP